jgi:aspartate/methionine/tyrosine aminotransferase
MSVKKRERYQFSVIRERMKEYPGRVLDFALGELQHELPPSLVGLATGSASPILERANLDEHHAFGERAASYLSREFGVVVEPEQILPVPSGRVAMTALMACLLEPGDGVVVTEPGYPAFARVAAHRHCRVFSVPLDPAEGFLPDLSGVPQDDLGGMRLAALNYPNNPTGSVLASETVEVLVGNLGKSPILFNDSTYGPLVYNQPPTSLLADSIGVEPGQSVVELHSLAKLFALGPLAISFLIGSPDVIEQLRHYSDFAWSPLSSLHIQVAAQALEEEEYVKEVRELYRRRVERVRGGLSHLGFEPYPTPAGLYVLTRVPASIAGQEVSSAREAADVLMDQFGVAVAFWDIDDTGYLRFTSLYGEGNLTRLVDLKKEMRISQPRRS